MSFVSKALELDKNIALCILLYNIYFLPFIVLHFFVFLAGWWRSVLKHKASTTQIFEF